MIPPEWFDAIAAGLAADAERVKRAIAEAAEQQVGVFVAYDRFGRLTFAEPSSVIPAGTAYVYRDPGALS